MYKRQEGGCIINLHNNQITFNNHVKEGGVPENSEMLTMKVYQEEEHTTTMIREKLEEVTGISNQTKKEVEDVLLDNHRIFRDQPGRVNGYEHKFVVTDNTPYCIRGWPIPIKYQNAVDQEIRKMEKCGVIERAASLYINPVSYTHLDVYKRQSMS